MHVMCTQILRGAWRIKPAILAFDCSRCEAYILEKNVRDSPKCHLLDTKERSVLFHCSVYCWYLFGLFLLALNFQSPLVPCSLSGPIPTDSGYRGWQGCPKLFLCLMQNTNFLLPIPSISCTAVSQTWQMTSFSRGNGQGAQGNGWSGGCCFPPAPATWGHCLPLPNQSWRCSTCLETTCYFLEGQISYFLWPASTWFGDYSYQWCCQLINELFHLFIQCNCVHFSKIQIACAGPLDPDCDTKSCPHGSYLDWGPCNLHGKNTAHWSKQDDDFFSCTEWIGVLSWIITTAGMW